MTSNSSNPRGRIDRAFQRELLERMRAVYPRRLTTKFPDGQDEETIVANLRYLEEHGLCVAGIEFGLDDQFSWAGSIITARGIDFIEDDGGVSSILGTITVRLHADALRELLTAKIDAASIPAGEKSKLKSSLGSLSETALKAATTDLVETGLQHLPNVVEWLRKFAGL